MEKDTADPIQRTGRARDAERTRQAILDAAEVVFAEHGYDGARFDAIARLSGYNRSLIAQYFGDKLGLYTEVNRRIDRELNELESRALAPLLADEAVATDPHRFRTFLETAIGALFDILLDHPRFLRILLWEQAEGWQTYSRIASQFNDENVDRINALFARARRSGLLRSDFDPFIQFVLAEQFCWSYLGSFTLYQTFITAEDLSSAAMLARAREFLIGFVVNGMMVHPT